MRLGWIRLLLLAGLLVASTSSAFAAGFSIIEQSVSGLGTAFSGGAAAEDASTIFFNPAGMTLLEGQQVVAGMHVIVPSAKFDADGANNALPSPPFNNQISGGNGGDGGVVKPVPNFFYAANLGNGWSVGLGVSAPFGLATSYDKDWIGRYHAVDSDVLTVNFNPSVAYRVNEQLSVGAGVSAQYIDVNLTSMVDFGLGAYKNSGFNPLLAGLASNPNADIYADMNADDWGYGFNLGLLYEFDKNSRIGAAYRSRIKHTVTGDVDFSAANPAFLVLNGMDAAAAASFVDQDLQGDITLPASASLNGYFQITSEWALMADVTWTEWSTFEELLIEFADGSESLTTEKWDDNWRYSVGTTYAPNEKLTLRLGLAYDETPVPSAAYRTPRIPDNDRIWTAFGVGYQMTQAMNLDFGYAHLFVKDARIDKEAVGDDLTRGALHGEYDSSVDIASLQLTYNF